MNKLVYDKVFTLTNGMFDEHDTIKPYAILDLFQTIAAEHADILGSGTEFCNLHHYGWILSRQECFIYQSPKPKESVVITTFPHQPSIVGFKREYIMKSLKGDVLAQGCALWVLVDFTTHQMVKKRDIYPEGEFISQTLFPNKIARPSSVKLDGELIDTYCVKKSNIDAYHHMNNAKYAELIFDYLNDATFAITYFAICYHNEIKEHSSMQIYRQEKTEGIYLTGCIQDKVIFTSIIKGETNEIN